MPAKSSLPIFARLGQQEFPVRWAWFRPEVQVGDTVRLPAIPGGKDGWESFLVVGKQFRQLDVSGDLTSRAIHLDVEPLTGQE